MAEEKIMRRETKYRGKLHGGRKDAIFDYLLGTDDLAGRDAMFAKIKLEPDGLIGYHEHNGETETYYILSGEGIYNDGEKNYLVKPGEIYHCENGKGHSIENVGKDFLEFIALIMTL